MVFHPPAAVCGSVGIPRPAAGGQNIQRIEALLIRRWKGVFRLAKRKINRWKTGRPENPGTALQESLDLDRLDLYFVAIVEGARDLRVHRRRFVRRVGILG